MLLIASALAEELETALNLCSRRTKMRIASVPLWKGERQGASLYLVKLGTGPRRSASVLKRTLQEIKPDRILLIGYAGALDPDLRLGDLVVVNRAHAVEEETWGGPFSELRFDAGRPLAETRELMSLGHASGLSLHCGAALTTPCVIGDPAQKRVLFQRFRASIVEMETAALAQVSAVAGIPLSCVRVVSDEADDDFLAFLSYAPGSGPIQRAAKTLAAGGWLHRYSQWRERSQLARQNLSNFLIQYLNTRN
jgi:adenosylhomocysteine nucleosidase